jgi:hypothetical protein
MVKLLIQHRIFQEQCKFIEHGIGEEEAYNLAVAKFKKQRAFHEMRQRVAQEQKISSDETTPCSVIIEELLLEEKKALEKATINHHP